jgi:hypothetical protein
VPRRAFSSALRSTAFGASKIKRLSVEWGIMRVNLLRFTVVFCTPIVRWRIGFQSAFSLSFALRQEEAPNAPERLLI